MQQTSTAAVACLGKPAPAARAGGLAAPRCCARPRWLAVGPPRRIRCSLLSFLCFEPAPCCRHNTPQLLEAGARLTGGALTSVDDWKRAGIFTAVVVAALATYRSYASVAGEVFGGEGLGSWGEGQAARTAAAWTARLGRHQRRTWCVRGVLRSASLLPCCPTPRPAESQKNRRRAKALAELAALEKEK